MERKQNNCVIQDDGEGQSSDEDRGNPSMVTRIVI